MSHPSRSGRFCGPGKDLRGCFRLLPEKFRKTGAANPLKNERVGIGAGNPVKIDRVDDEGRGVTELMTPRQDRCQNTPPKRGKSLSVKNDVKSPLTQREMGYQIPKMEIWSKPPSLTNPACAPWYFFRNRNKNRNRNRKTATTRRRQVATRDNKENRGQTAAQSLQTTKHDKQQ